MCTAWWTSERGCVNATPDGGEAVIIMVVALAFVAPFLLLTICRLTERPAMAEIRLSNFGLRPSRRS
jgi:hypothetical protein